MDTGINGTDQAQADQIIDESKLQSGPAVSPFLPGTKIQFAWDSTSLGMLKTCPRLYQYDDRRLRPKG
jgi:hypothetical protein